MLSHPDFQRWDSQQQVLQLFEQYCTARLSGRSAPVWFCVYFGKPPRVKVCYSKTTLKLAWERTIQGMYKQIYVCAGIQLRLGNRVTTYAWTNNLPQNMNKANLTWFAPIYSDTTQIVTQTRVNRNARKRNKLLTEPSWPHKRMRQYEERKEARRWGCGEKATCLSSSNLLYNQLSACIPTI